jgi:hypothetical protein
LDTEDFFAGFPIAGDAINAPAAKQLTKIRPLFFIFSSCCDFLLRFVAASDHGCVTEAP